MTVEDDFRAAVQTVAREEIQALAVPLFATLAGVETAVLVIIRKLADRGVLPVAEAKAAIDEAHAILTPQNKAGGQGHVLRQMSQMLLALLETPTTAHH
jgi:hypothetical protein